MERPFRETLILFRATNSRRPSPLTPLTLWLQEQLTAQEQARHDAQKSEVGRAKGADEGHALKGVGCVDQFS